MTNLACTNNKRHWNDSIKQYTRIEVKSIEAYWILLIKLALIAREIAIIQSSHIR